MAGLHTDCCGVILAGGLSRRFNGTNKAFMEIGGRRMIDYVYGVFRAVFDEIIIVTNMPLAYQEFDATIATDVFPVRSSLTGIHAGLFYTLRPFAFVSACDTPFLRENVVRHLLGRIKENTGVILPETGKGMEPLCAVYSKACLPVIERHIMQGNYQIKRTFKSLRVEKVPEVSLRQADPELKSFFNINTSEDLAAAESDTELYKADKTKQEGEENGYQSGSKGSEAAS